MRAMLVALAIGMLCVPLWGLAAAAEPAPAPPNTTEVDLPPPPSEEELSKITAPAVSPVIKTPQGYTVTLDLSEQVLTASSPKKEVWIAPELEANQTVKVKRDGAVLQQGRTALAKLNKGRTLFITKVEKGWAATRLLDGDKVKSGWIRTEELETVAEEPPPHKTLTGAVDSQFASAAVLIQKAKQFDDGLYAAVEIAMQDGVGPVTGKRDWLAQLAAKIEASQGGVPLAQLYAASALGGGDASVPAELERLVASERAAFLGDEKRSKPLGFYTWNRELAGIFQQDRLLQSPLDVAEHAGGIQAIAGALAADGELRKSYEQVLRLNERLTNPLKTAGYRELLAAGGDAKPGGPVSFFPPSRGPETDLVMRLYGDKPIPEGFDLMKEVIARLKSGEMSFEPQPDSGWYEHQLWSLEPLVRFESTPEGSRLKINDEYKKLLEELFKGTYALTRETHVKQLEVAEPAAAAFDRPVKEREKVYIAPNPQVEILPTMYLRRSQSYAYVRQVLEETFGADNVAKMTRLTAAGPVKVNLAEELTFLERLFAGAHVVACRQLGLAEDAAAAAAGDPDECAVSFLRWQASVRSDGDLAKDARMMVPVFFDQQRRKTKVWVMLGWTTSGVGYGYDKQPAATVTDPDGNVIPTMTDPQGKLVAGDEGPELIYHGTWRQVATPVFAEVYVTKLLNRDEFRRHCDTYGTQAAILDNLQ